MKTIKTQAHFVAKYLHNPTNPVSINLIGAGGTGSQLLTALGKMHTSLLAFDHPGIFVRVFDEDIITKANRGRILFTNEDIGRYKADVFISRINRFLGTNWKAIPETFTAENATQYPANITLSCVDTVRARMTIAESLKKAETNEHDVNRPFYWMDFGNSKYSGQVILSTVGAINQPRSEKYTTVNNLPFITDEFRTLLVSSEEPDAPSCSAFEAIEKQDLYINSSLANMGASLLWSMFRNVLLEYRGLFLNLKDYRSQPIPVKKAA